MLLADIGNSRIHIYNGKEVIHLTHDKGIEEYKDKTVYYITVNRRLKSKLSTLKNWVDISDKIVLNGEYKTMGVDRKALCLSRGSGIFISAGSAITVDIVEEGEYQGGFILLGLKRYIESYGLISSALNTTLNRDIKLNTLPKSTRDSISYGILAPIKSIIERFQNEGNKQLYISGGDGEFLSSLFKNATFDERLIFQGMQKALGKI